jgi:hypothetical protein
LGRGLGIFMLDLGWLGFLTLVRLDLDLAS